VPHYSYETCGIASAYSNFAKYQRAALKSAAEIVTIIEDYVAEMRNNIERRVTSLNSVETRNCPGFVDSCTCGSACTPGQGTWQSAPGVVEPGYSIDLASITVTHLDGVARPVKSAAERRAQCLSQLVQGNFKKVARLEYNDPARMGFLQYGDQGSGVYFSWPGVTFCPSTAEPFDPRFRPWYVSAVSGPKDVVIVMDQSGSMTGSRWTNAQEAAKAVLNTLSKFDYTNIVLFSDFDSTFQGTDVLHAATQGKLRDMADWIDRQSPGGGTNFRIGFQKAFQILSNSASAASSGCNKAILFLTDGADTSNFDPGELQALNTMGASIFTYSFGASADRRLPKAIACQNSGIWYQVPDGAAGIRQAMSGYYAYYAGALASTNQIRWTMYQELKTRNDLITGCLPAYDRTVLPPRLLGVVCMDVSIIMDIPAFRAKSDFPAANTKMEQEARQCTRVSLSQADLEALRMAVSPQSSCVAAPLPQASGTSGSVSPSGVDVTLLLPLLSAWLRK